MTTIQGSLQVGDPKENQEFTTPKSHQTPKLQI